MIKMFVVFLFLALAIGLAIQSWQQLKGKAKWQLTKIAAFSIMCSALAVGLLTIFVILF
jgi:hypothetical protein